MAPGGTTGGGSAGHGRVQGRQHSDVSTARLPVSTRTLRGCLIGEGQLNKDIFPPTLSGSGAAAPTGLLPPPLGPPLRGGLTPVPLAQREYHLPVHFAPENAIKPGARPHRGGGGGCSRALAAYKPPFGAFVILAVLSHSLASA
jgi:hypothetical protein